MIQSKKKICAGCHKEQYIYKNIDGKKYCISCTNKLLPFKSIKKMSQKFKIKLVEKKQLIEEDKLFYKKVWDNLSKLDEGSNYEQSYRSCEECNKKLGLEINFCFFHHILEKRNYPEYRHKDWNIALLCKQCHNEYETNPDTHPNLVRRRKESIEIVNKINESKI